ncbi:hypothetical protein CVT26_002343 [Gymnopilus dilepis]|uniref:DUF4218 domain-containing protein n=1 Tax=Gymnopilus dilepis TaxID=231916 RepID=A0A409Y3J4_9AGAR|nr:hypothetical protein CVT26_002343 [Gymnopilus dilepis]
MPSCHCQWADCNGKVISKRLFDDHQRQDKRARINTALEATQQAIEKQNDVLESYVASLTLSDEATGCTTTPGGRLWARNPTEAAGPADDINQSFRLPTADALHTIHEVKGKIDTLVVAAKLPLQNVAKPLTPLDTFPLESLLRDALLLQDCLDSVSVNRECIREAKLPVAQSLTSILCQLRGAQTTWSRQVKLLSETQNRANSFDTGQHFSPILGNLNPVIQVSVFTMVAMQVIIHASRRGCHFLLAMLRYIVQLSLMQKNSSLAASEIQLLSDFPIDPDTAARKLHLNGHEIIHAVCPNSKCHKTYAPTFKGNSPLAIYPSHCHYKLFASGPECGTRLTRTQIVKDIEIEVPVKRFVSFSFKDFVANLTSRLGFEDLMDAFVESQDDVMRDLRDGQYLRREFKAPDGTPFYSNTRDARYIFSLCIDFFNPFMNKQAGKKVSIGIISVVCLSLPPSHRYRPENMFLVGVIPGPNEPPLTAINHYLTPIIDEFEEFWNPGVYFTRTSNHPDGRLIYCALVLVVCDLLAARKAAGFAACTHEHFCSVCHCTRSREGYGNTRQEAWKRRTDKDYREAADLFLNAETPDARSDEFNKSGVRWSELLRLSYFDLSRCVVVDSMHNLFLGLIKEHFKGILGIALPTSKERAIKVAFGPRPDNFSDNDLKGIDKVHAWLEAPVNVTFPNRAQGLKKLSGVNLNSLVFVCNELGCLPAQKTRYFKKDYVVEVLDWRLRQTEDGTGDASRKHGCVLEESDMTEIRSDLKTILTPSWLASVPLNLGNAAHGKLKADQWRALGTVHLPISLARLWSLHINQGQDGPRALRNHTILLVTMALVSAVILATSRTTSADNATAYRDYMLSYLEGIQHLFPEYKMRPNHHMAVHIYDYLLLFGPVHSWWTFPFERMIGAVQRMPHNSKIGEVEETIARAYTRSANLRSIVAKSGCPEVIRHSEAIFRKFTDPKARDTLQTDIQAFTSVFDSGNCAQEEHQVASSPLPEEVKLAFEIAQISVPSYVQLLSNLSLGGLTYSTYSKHQGNSCILLNQTQDGDIIPARIVHIIQFSTAGRINTYFGVRRHRPACLERDPLSSFLVLGAAIWDTELYDLELIRPVHVSSHFACLPITIHGRQLVAVLSLSRDYRGQASTHASLSLRHIRQLRLR